VCPNDRGEAVSGPEVDPHLIRRNPTEEQMNVQHAELSRQDGSLDRLRHEIRGQIRLLNLISDSMGHGLVAADREGNFLIWNDCAKRLLGHGPAGLPAEQWAAHYKIYHVDGITPFPPEELPLMRALRGEAAEAKIAIQPTESEAPVILEVAGQPVKNGHGELLGGVVAFRDVTDRKAAEHQIQQLNQDLETQVDEHTAQLLDANRDLEGFAYSVSHDLRAPLRHISGFARILMEDFSSELPDEVRRYLLLIGQGVSNLSRLMDELSNLAEVGRQPLAFDRIQLSAIVEDVVTKLGQESEGRRMEWKIGELPEVECDGILFRQVFQNLIGNAVKFSRPRSSAVIEIGQMEKDGTRVIFVKDNGVGFDMGYADRLFNVFQRLHSPLEFEGAGVGLAVVKRIVQKHGGRIWAESAPDCGATFYFTWEHAKIPVSRVPPLRAEVNQ
jgi:signal transduction histidine kinase